MNFIDKMKQTITKGYENASHLLNEAAEKTKELGDKGLLEFEIKRLEKEVENILPVLGSEVYALHRMGKLKLMDDTGQIQKLLKEIENREKQIAEKEKKIRS